jgi:hypothetical protein
LLLKATPRVVVPAAPEALVRVPRLLNDPPPDSV